MTSEPSITLYDVASTLNPQACSPNTWKARFVLNYKRIPHRTIWVPCADIETTLVNLGCAPSTTKPNDTSKPHYTLPAIVDSGSTPPVIMADSLAIAEYLDKNYPDRPVFPKQGRALEYAFEQWFMSLLVPQVPMIMIPRVWMVFDERNKEYFRKTRELWFGKKLEEFNPEGPVREGHWKALETTFDKLAAVVDKNGSGVDYVAGGSAPTRADFIYLSFLIVIRDVQPDEWEKRVKHWGGGRWERMLKKTEEWQTV